MARKYGSRKRRQVPWAGWAKIAPQGHARTVMKRNCGRKCFLGPDKSFPVCAKGTCKVNSKGAWAAYIRAREWGKKKSSYKGEARPRHRRSGLHPRREEGEAYPGERRVQSGRRRRPEIQVPQIRVPEVEELRSQNPQRRHAQVPQGLPPPARRSGAPGQQDREAWPLQQEVHQEERPQVSGDTRIV